MPPARCQEPASRSWQNLLAAPSAALYLMTHATYALESLWASGDGGGRLHFLPPAPRGPHLGTSAVDVSSGGSHRTIGRAAARRPKGRDDQRHRRLGNPRKKAHWRGGRDLL